MHTPQDVQFLHLKFRLLDKVVGIILEKIDKNEIDEEEAREMSKFVLAETEKLKSADDIPQFLVKLASNWIMFEEFKNMESKREEIKSMDIKDSTETNNKIDLLRQQLTSFINNSNQQN